MKIVGTGVDIVEISRIRRIAKKEPRFLKRVFTASELSYSLKSKKRWERLAVRFAAKEAVWKALEGNGVALNDIVITRAADGKPGVNLKKLKNGSKLKASLSLSHSDNYAVAFCILYQS